MKNKESSASKIVLDSFESLFGDQEDMGKEDRVRMIPLSELYEFAGHPFRVLDDEKRVNHFSCGIGHATL